MQDQVWTLIAGAVIASLSAGMGAASSMAIFYFNRENSYLSSLTEVYSELLSNITTLIDERSRNGKVSDASLKVKASIQLVKLVDRNTSRVDKLEEIRGDATGIGRYEGRYPLDGKAATHEQDSVNNLLKIRDELVTSVRLDVIDKRPLKNLFDS